MNVVRAVGETVGLCHKWLKFLDIFMPRAIMLITLDSNGWAI